MRIGLTIPVGGMVASEGQWLVSLSRVMPAAFGAILGDPHVASKNSTFGRHDHFPDLALPDIPEVDNKSIPICETQFLSETKTSISFLALQEQI